MAAQAVPSSGRRFYVHERSLAALAAEAPDLAPLVRESVALLVVSRVIRHALVDDRNMSGAAEVVEITAFAERARATANRSLTALFQDVVVEDRRPDAFGSTSRLLGADESVIAYCYESGYFTFATGEASACVMFAETGSLHGLRSMIREHPGSERDLTIVSGTTLHAFRGDVGVGPDTQHLYRAPKDGVVQSPGAWTTAMDRSTYVRLVAVPVVSEPARTEIDTAIDRGMSAWLRFARSLEPGVHEAS